MRPPRTPPRTVWQPLAEADLPRLHGISATIHADLPGRMDVLDEKRRLCPEACRKLVLGEDMVGYALAHPWRLFDIPKLDAPLGSLPAEADCLYMHDVAILPEGRGDGAAPRYVEHLRALARSRALGTLACVSVYGTSHLWGSTGFEIVTDPRLATALRGYGENATYMVARV